MESKEMKKNIGRRILTVCLLSVMLVTGVLAAYRGSDWAIRYISEKYQEYYGYLQNEAEETEIMLEAAIGIMENVKNYPNGTWTMEGIQSVVQTQRGYYEKNGASYSLGDYGSIKSGDFLSDGDKKIALQYSENGTYIKYADGKIIPYKNAGQLKKLEKAMQLPYATEIQLYVWMDETYYYSQNPGLKILENLPEYDLEITMILLVAAVSSLLLAVAMSKRGENSLQTGKYVLTEVPIVVLALIYIEILLISDFFDESTDINRYNEGIKIFITALTGILLLTTYWSLRECVLKFKENRILQDSWIMQNGRRIGKLVFEKSNYANFNLTEKMWIKKLAFLVFGGAYSLFFLLVERNFGVLLFWILIICFNVKEMHVLKSLNQVYRQVDDIAGGEMVLHEVDEQDLTYDITTKLNGVAAGFEEAMEKRLSSEKMKVELVANVSHDLKTPLTSIISYVNLLKEEDMSEVAASYVKILEDKSNQLKNLVSDVFDLAKANSGQEVQIENIDGIMLIRQVLADMSDVIEHSGRKVKTDIQPDTYMVSGDGRKLYRALQNLIDNGLKYSMEGTRIYIQSEIQQDKLRLTIKNIASYEMNFKGEDIVERFVRGDKSRTTEGSGLGLSIAKSFVEVSGGTLQVEVEGDMFKVEVEFGKQ